MRTITNPEQLINEYQKSFVIVENWQELIQEIDETIENIENQSYINQLLKMKKEINGIIEDEHSFIDSAQVALDRIDNPYKQIIEMRVKGIKWEDIAFEVCYSYRHTIKIYNKAIEDLFKRFSDATKSKKVDNHPLNTK